MNLTPQEVQDLEDAIFYAGIFLTKKQESPGVTASEIRTIGLFITRILKLKTKLSEPAVVAGTN
jgi:hypothetical protein